MKWMSVNRWLPASSDRVMVYVPNAIHPICTGCFYEKGKNQPEDSWVAYDFGDSDLSATVTHWMPLPDAP